MMFSACLKIFNNALLAVRQCNAYNAGKDINFRIKSAFLVRLAVFFVIRKITVLNA